MGLLQEPELSRTLYLLLADRHLESNGKAKIQWKTQPLERRTFEEMWGILHFHCCSDLTGRFGGHLPAPPLHPESLNTIMSNISQEDTTSPGHPFNTNVFIKSICQFMDWSEQEESVGISL